MSYWQGSSRDADIENRIVDIAGEGEGGMNWEGSVEMYTLPYAKLDNQWKCDVWCRELKSGALRQPVGVGAGRELQEGGDICIPTTDACWCLAETNTLL